VNSPEIKAWLGKVVGKEAEDLSRHDKWLCMMYPRLRLLKEFLREDGILWISIDDHEAHGLKILCDEVFGRINFLATIIWHKKHTRSNDARYFSDNHDFILSYAKNKSICKIKLLDRTNESDSNYSNIDNDPRGEWASGPCHAKTPNPKDIYEIVTPSGRIIMPPRGTSWRFSKEKFQNLVSENRIYFGPRGNNIPRYKRFKSDVQNGLVPTTIWFREEVGDNQDAKTEVKSINSDDVFSTPKPEMLIGRIIHISTNPDDLVLDSFAGSGTTGAVAHKMGRQHISVEMGDHAVTHIVPRYQKVISGDDQGGISESVGWQGGEGFRYCTLGETLFDADGNIADAVSFSDLAAHVFFCETGAPIQKRAVSTSPFIGTFQGRAIYLLYAKDSAGVASVKKGNVLDGKTLDALPKAKDGNTHRVIYAEGCTLSESRLRKEGVTFKHIPYQIAGA
jgi:adenine specific DNA methylase Mod